MFKKLEIFLIFFYVIVGYFCIEPMWALLKDPLVFLPVIPWVFWLLFLVYIVLSDKDYMKDWFLMNRVVFHFGPFISFLFILIFFMYKANMITNGHLYFILSHEMPYKLFLP